jgi:uncharacterized protein with FMN-binding domain
MQTTKKLIIGIAVFLIFVAYSLGLRHEQPTIAKPQSLENTNSTVSTSAKSSQNTNSSPSTTTPSGQYTDGTYDGNTYNAYYGNVQVSVTITSGKITAVKFLQYPDTHSTSVFINQQAMPYLQQEAIQTQNANVQVISGATFTSQAFIQSLTSALSKA